MNAVTEKRDAPSASANAAAAPARNEGSLLPPVDVIEDATGITLYADLPGVPKSGVQVRVDGDQLTLEGEMTLAVPQGMQPTHAEVRRSRYLRAFTLSKELDAGQVSAEMSHGVLRLRIPKVPHAQPRRVQVQVA